MVLLWTHRFSQDAEQLACLRVTLEPAPFMHLSKAKAVKSLHDAGNTSVRTTDGKANRFSITTTTASKIAACPLPGCVVGKKVFCQKSFSLKNVGYVAIAT